MLQSLPPFFEMEYIQTTVPHYIEISDMAYDMAYMEPIVVPEKKIIKEKTYHIPKDELAVNRGAKVYSANGEAIGQVDEFLVDESGHHVTHLILREGHVLGKKDVFIPVSEIDSIDEADLHLKLDKREVEKLPTIPVRRLWS
jgi:sporulation protein YlmC with PRC-barrel domain